MRPSLFAVLLLVAGVFASGRAAAQIPVTDLARLGINVPEYLQLVQQLNTMQSQLQQAVKTVQKARDIYNAANQLTHPNDVATDLNDLRVLFPGDGTNLTDTTQQGGQAAANYAANQVYAPSAANQYFANTLQPAAASIASFEAQGQAVFQAATARLQGLEELRRSLDTAHDAKTTEDLKARVQAEGAGVSNDIMRLQGLKMMQGAQTANLALQDESADHCRFQTLAAFYAGQNNGAVNCVSAAQYTQASATSAGGPTTGGTAPSSGDPSVAGSWDQYLGQHVGSGQCVALVQAADPSVGLTATWREGEAVSSATDLTPGTIIATFGPNGTYTNSLDGSSHAAIYLGTNADGSINVVDQWTGQAAHERTIFNVPGKAAVNTASAFHVVTH